jgi:hypothetical protein
MIGLAVGLSQSRVTQNGRQVVAQRASFELLHYYPNGGIITPAERDRA